MNIAFRLTKNQVILLSCLLALLLLTILLLLVAHIAAPAGLHSVAGTVQPDVPFNRP